MKLNPTILLKQQVEKKRKQTRTVIHKVYEALKEKGYNPVGQLTGYLMSGDPTYITSHNGARQVICSVEREELLEEFVRSYLSSNTIDPSRS